MRNIYFLKSLCSPLNTIKENHPILNQMYNILAELQAQDKKITMCKVHAHIGIEENEVYKLGNEAMDIPKVTTTRLLFDHLEGKKL